MIERVPPDEKTRGRPFSPGNPGRPPGSKNKTTRLVEQLLADEADTITRILIEKALAGDAKCIQLCLDRLSPRRNGRPMDFELPAIKQPQDLAAAIAAIAKAVGDGVLTAEEASHLVQVLEGYAKAVTLHEISARLERLESQGKKSNDA